MFEYDGRTMTQTADPLPDSAPLPRDLLVRVRDTRRAADDAEVQILELALEFAQAHPALPGRDAWEPAEAPSWLEDTTDLLPEEDREWIGLPAIRWDAPAAFAAANGTSTTTGKALIRDHPRLGRSPRHPPGRQADPRARRCDAMQRPPDPGEDHLCPQRSGSRDRRTTRSDLRAPPLRPTRP